MQELTIFSAFVVGLLGGGHCVGMCGGVVGAVSASLPGVHPSITYLFSYNAGRVSSYVIAGLLAGWLGSSSLLLNQIFPMEQLLYLLANLMLMALGLYLAGFWQGVLLLEKIGGLLWRRLQPISSKLLPLSSRRQAFGLGLLWGWLPCGLVYSMLVTALAAGSMLQGGLLMLAFGLGTLPTLLAMGMMAVKLKLFLQHALVRQVSGMLILAYGMVGMWHLI